MGEFTHQNTMSPPDLVPFCFVVILGSFLLCTNQATNIFFGGGSGSFVLGFPRLVYPGSSLKPLKSVGALLFHFGEAHCQNLVARSHPLSFLA